MSAFRIYPDQQSRVNMGTLAHLDDAIVMLTDSVLRGSRPCMNISSFEKAYMLYDSQYQTWKEHQKRRLSRDAAIRKISQRYSVVLFFLADPLYKTFQPLRKVTRSALRWLRDGSVRGNGRERDRASVRDAPGADRATM